MARTKINEARLLAALERLLEGKPEIIEFTGQLTLNKINKEAGAGTGAIYKLKDTNEVVFKGIQTKIDEYNRNMQLETGFESVQIDESQLSETEKLKREIKKLKLEKNKEAELKTRYRKERDDAITARKELESLNSALMFRVYELQDEIRTYSVTSIS